MQAREYRINWEIYTPYAGAARMLLLEMEVHNQKAEIISFIVKFLFSTDPHCQFLDVSQDMKPT